MFEAIHGSAPRMVKEGRLKYADPSSMIKASAMLLRHIGRIEQATTLEMALDMCIQFEKKIKITGRDNGATAQDFSAYIVSWVENPGLKDAWETASKVAVAC